MSEYSDFLSPTPSLSGDTISGEVTHANYVDLPVQDPGYQIKLTPTSSQLPSKSVAGSVPQDWSWR